MARPIAASSSTDPSDRPYQAFCTTDHSAKPALNRRDGGSRGACDCGRLLGTEFGQHRQRFLIAARLDDVDGVDLVGIGRIGLEKHDRGARFDKRSLGALVGFLGQRTVDDGKRAFFVGLEDLLRGDDPFGGIRREQRQTAEGGFHGAAQTVVETNGGGAIRHLVDGSTPVAASMILPSVPVT